MQSPVSLSLSFLYAGTIYLEAGELRNLPAAFENPGCTSPLSINLPGGVLYKNLNAKVSFSLCIFSPGYIKSIAANKANPTAAIATLPAV